jgi:NADPH:quinone reductase-like Zn-dependent oxidoreductase
MLAVRFHEVGGPEVLRVEQIETPEPAVGEVRVRVAASAFNSADNGMRAGVLPIPVQLPHVPGYDVSGVIDAVGDGVDTARVGEAVFGFLPMERDGGAAELVVAPSDAFVPAPHSIPLADAAAVPSVFLAAWQALIDDGHLESGQRVLIVGAGGVVGKYAIQLAKRIGAYVIATASPRSASDVAAAGADELIDRSEIDILDAVTEPVDLLVNLAPIDEGRFTSLVGLVRNGGAVVSTTA